MNAVVRHLLAWLTIATFCGLVLLVGDWLNAPPLLAVFAMAVVGPFLVYGPLMSWLEESEYLDDTTP